MATLDDVATFVASAASLTVGTNLFKGQMPPTATDAVTVIYETLGLPSEFVFHQASVSQEKPRLQIVCRGAKDDYQTPRATAETIYRAVAAVKNQTLTSTKYQSIDALQPPFLMGRDANGRTLIAFNCQVYKELSA